MALSAELNATAMSQGLELREPVVKAVLPGHGQAYRVVAGAAKAEAFAADALLPQRVLYVGQREADFAPFLRQHFAKVQCIARSNTGIDQAVVKDFDVVLLDWPQGESAIQSLGGTSLPDAAIERVDLLGGPELQFRRDAGALRLTLPPPQGGAFVPAVRIRGRGLV